MEVIGRRYEEMVKNRERVRRKTRLAEIPVCAGQ